MVWQTLEAKLSTPRMSRYLKGHQDNRDQAATAYVHNMRIAESLGSIFHVLEVGLRNAIQRGIDPSLCVWIKSHDRLPTVLVDWRRWKEAVRREVAQSVAEHPVLQP
ncbi:hypothetical protein K814_0119485 [Pseudomonas fluorescens LMG 5329]|uniref:Uncharacterized protein n=1 Tax=Pseudomonas fluorescens LMG 5329 TaxID=1324332 RepID=A0A0A1YWM8_PSEFL|nr:hypothetical protein K814_0119485 [Pseudomonas fluorescens LMG 5329]